MTLSIAAVIPAYNCENTIGAVLDSLFAAELSNPLEVVLVDDASTDNTAEICRRYPLTLVRQSVNRGPAHCRNLAIRRTHGDMLLFLDTDIAFAPELLNAMIEYMEKHPHLAGLFTLTSPEPLNKTYISRYFALQEYLRFMDYIERGYESWSFISTRCGLLKRAIFEETGGFNESFALAAYEDLEFSSRMDSRHQLALQPHFLVHHYGPDSLWKMLKRLHVNARGVMAFPPAMRKKASEPFIKDRNARALLGVCWLLIAGGCLWRPLWLMALVAHAGAVQQAAWLLRGCLKHEGPGFMLRSWLTYNMTLAPFATGVFMGLLDKAGLTGRRAQT